MRNENFDRAVQQILKTDDRYPAEAYALMPQILDYTCREVQKQVREIGNDDPDRPDNHVTGQQLAEGLREYMLQEYGPFAFDILSDLNIRATIDIGNLVYNLISVGCFGKTDDDRLEDFEEVYDFQEAFVEPFAVQDPQYAKDCEANGEDMV